METHYDRQTEKIAALQDRNSILERTSLQSILTSIFIDISFLSVYIYKHHGKESRHIDA